MSISSHHACKLADIYVVATISQVQFVNFSSMCWSQIKVWVRQDYVIITEQAKTCCKPQQNI